MTPATQDGGPPFHQNELLRWRAYDDRKGEYSIRQVNYLELDERDPKMAYVAWGMRHDGSREQFRVRLDELARPLPKPPDARFMPPPVPPAPKKPTAITTPNIPPLRAALREAISARDAQQGSVDAAAQLVSRAESELASARSTLASLTLREVDRARELEATLRAGTPLRNGHDTDADEVSRARAERDVAAGEKVLERFQSELRDVRGAAATANSAVYAAASKLASALYAADGQRLVESLTSARLGIWPENAVEYIRAHLDRAETSAQWKELHKRLLHDVDADIE